MTRRYWLAVSVTLVAILSASVLSAESESDAQQQQPFRATTDLVSVPVTVRSGGSLVKGLTGEDFVLTDSGIEQAIERVESESLAIDVTLALDTSGSTELIVEQLKRDAAEIARILRPQDRVRLLTIDTYATQVVPFQSGTQPLRLDKMTKLGLSSVHDAIAAALLERVPLGRRHLIVVMTAGIDSISALGVGALEVLAQTSDAVLQVFLMDMAALEVRSSFQCFVARICEQQARFWIPYQDREFLRIRQAAETTGGELRSAGLFKDRTPVGMFQEVFEDYRHSYVLRYSPRGVRREGWHPIEVRLKQSSPGHTLRARRGYSIGVRVRDPEPVPEPRAGVLPATVPTLVRAYGRNDFAPVNAGLNSAKRLAELVIGFRAGGNPWPNDPRREAVFLLELADSAMYSREAGAADAAIGVLTWYEKLVRHPLEPDLFERLWYWAEIALFEGVLSPSNTAQRIENALTRFPNEPRYLLARAFTLDQQRHTDALVAGNRVRPIERDVNRVVAAYEDAAKFPETRFEARVRQGFLLYRLGRHKEAAAALNISDPPDRELAYLHGLVLGHVYDALDDFAAADRSLRYALEAWPGAQSAKVVLMTMAMRRGDRASAERMAESIEQQSPNSFDPFWRYWQGDARFFASIRALLRQFLK